MEKKVGPGSYSETLLLVENIKEYISKANSIKYISMPKKLSEEEIISRVIKAFSDSHVYMSVSPTEDLERIRKNYFQLMNMQ